MNTLRIEMLRLREGDLTLTLDHRPGLFDLDDDEWTFEGQVTGEIVFHLADQRDIFAKGQIRARATGQCGWCLDPVTVDIEAELNTIYLPVSLEPSDDVAVEHINESDPDVAYHGEGDHLDPSSEIRDAILLALPTLPLRTPDEKTCRTCKRDLSQPPHHEDWPDETTGEEPEWKRKLRGLGET